MKFQSSRITSSKRQQWKDFVFDSDNVFTNNYWSDWSGTVSYAIDGSTGNHDLSPLTNPYHLSAPVITYPTSDTLTLKDSVTIQWTASSDMFGHSITYSVFYSADDGTTWTELVSGLTTTSYTWNLMNIDNGTIVLLKVQATDSVGFKSFSISTSTFTIDNPATEESKPVDIGPVIGVIAIVLSLATLAGGGFFLLKKKA